MSTTIRLRASGKLALMAALLLLANWLPVQAMPLSYSFSGTTAAGTLLELTPGTVVPASGIGFTITGRTVTGVDLSAPGDGIGLFAATSTYDFGAFGTFTTDVGGDTYFQDCFSPSSITCVGMFDGGAGFLIGFPAIAADPDVGVPVGSPAGAFLVGSSFRFLGNSAGQGMLFDVAAISALSVVPAPGTLALLALGLVLLGVRQHRRR